MDDAAEAQLVERLRAGDEAAFKELFDEQTPVLLRLAFAFVKSASIAEDIAQETWVAVIAALDSFEGRSTLKTWIARIAVNRAKTRAARDGRNVPLTLADDGPGEPAVAPSRFSSWGLWNEWPDRWPETPEDLVHRREVREAIQVGLSRLSEAQCAVVTLRDLEGWTAEEACHALDLSEANQRVLLHRGRSRLRAILEVALNADRQTP